MSKAGCLPTYKGNKDFRYNTVEELLKVHNLEDKFIETYNSVIAEKTAQQQNQSIKEGVPELFESNPELANAVYEALGFGQENNTEVQKAEIERRRQEESNNKAQEIVNRGEVKKEFRPITKEDKNNKVDFNSLFSNISKVLTGEIKSEIEDANKILKQYLKEIHPDKFQEESQKLIAEIFTTAMITVGKKGDIIKLNELYEKYKQINDKYDAEYVDAVKKGEISKEQAMQALEEVGRKDSSAYAEISALEPQITPEQKQQAQQLYAEYLSQNPNGNTVGFKQWNNRQPQVNKLFESNPELANAVYEALGFLYSSLTNEDKIKIDNRAKEEVAVFNRLLALTKKNNFNEAYDALVDKIIEAGKDINRREEYIELGKFQEHINTYYGYLINDRNDKTAKDTKITDVINEIKEQTEKDKNKRKRNKITPQQKQQAQQIYSQYLEQGGQDIEGFEDFVKSQAQSNQEAETKPEEPKRTQWSREKASHDTQSDYEATMSKGIEIHQAQNEIARLIGTAMSINGFKTKENLRSLTGNHRLFGSLQGHIITLAELDGKVHAKVARHESMHYILDYCLSNEDYIKVVEAAQNEVNNHNLANGNTTPATEVEALEYLCDGFENFKRKPKTVIGNILYRIYEALSVLFNTFNKNRAIINNLYFKAERGNFSKSNSAIFNNNVEGEVRFSKSENNNIYTQPKSIMKLFDAYDGRSAMVINTKNLLNENIIEQSNAIGKIITKDIDTFGMLSNIYFQLQSDENFKEMNDLNLTIKGKMTSIPKYIEENGYDKACRDIVIKNTDGNAKRLITLSNKMFGTVVSDADQAASSILFAYPIVKAYHAEESDKTLLNTFVQMLDTALDVNRIEAHVKNTMKTRIEGESEVNAQRYQASYDKSNNVNDLINFRFINVIDNIRYSKIDGFDKNVTWGEYTTMMMEMSRDFRFDKGNQHRGGKFLTYDEIMDLLEKKGRRASTNRPLYDAVRNHFKSTMPNYHPENRSAMKELVEKEFNPNTGSFDFSKYGYGFMINRISEYLRIGSVTNQLFVEMAGEENFMGLLEILKRRQHNIQKNIVNYTYNYFNTIAKRDLVMIDTSKGKLVSFSEGEEQTKLRLTQLIESNCFEHDDKGEVIGVAERSIQINQDFKIVDNQYLAQMENASQIIDLNQASFSLEDISVIYSLLDSFYVGNIEQGSVYDINPNTDENGKYVYTLKKGVAAHVIEIMKVIKNNISKATDQTGTVQYQNISNNFIINANIETSIMSAIMPQKDAEGNWINSVLTRSPLHDAIAYGTNKLKMRLQEAALFKNGDEMLNPILNGDFSTMDMKELSGMQNHFRGLNWDKLNTHDRMDCFLNNLMYNPEDKVQYVLISHTGDRKMTNVAVIENNPYYKIGKSKTVKAGHVLEKSFVQIDKQAIGKSARLLYQFNQRIKEKSIARLESFKVTVNENQDLLVEGREVVREYGNMSEDAKYIEKNLHANIDYIVKGNKYVVGNAGKSKIFGNTNPSNLETPLETSTQYYEHFMQSIQGQMDLFYKELKDHGFVAGENISKFNTVDERNDLLDVYFITHLLMNESISNILTGSTEYAKNDEDYIKRIMGYTAPTSVLKGDPNSVISSIGETTNFVLLQDIPGMNPLFGDEKKDLRSDGVVYHPMFYRKVLKNSAGGDMSFIGNGSIKTVNHHHDPNTGKLHYMKCSETSINYSEYKKNIGRQVYNTLLNHTVLVKFQEDLHEVNLLEKFESIFESKQHIMIDGRRITKKKAFEIANLVFLDYLWNTETYNQAYEATGRAYDHIGHKVIFQSALKTGQTEINHWSKETVIGEDGNLAETGNYIFPSGQEVLTQQVSNDNYGLQQNKLQSTQAQEKTIMSQLIKIIGASSTNQDVYADVIESLNSITMAKIEELDIQMETETRTMQYKNELIITLLKSFDARREMLYKSNATTLEQIKRDVIEDVIKNLDEAIKPRVDGNIYVQEPTHTFFNRGKEVFIRPFRFMNEAGLEYNDISVLRQAVKEGKTVGIGLQEAVMAFPHQAEFGLNDDCKLENVFTVNNVDFYFTSLDYVYKEGKVVPKIDYSEFKQRVIDALLMAKQVTESNFAEEGSNNLDIILSGLEYNVRRKIKSILSKNKIKGNNYDVVMETIATYMWNLNESCNLYALRIPTTNTSSGFPTRIVEFDSDIDNTILTSAEKSILDGSDYDIDELNVYFPKIKSDVLAENLVGEDKFKNDFINAIFSYYGNTNNYESILSNITTENIIEAVADMQNSEHALNTPNHMFANQELNLSAARMVGYMVNMQTTVSEINSIINIMPDHEFKNRYEIFADARIQRLFFDVTTELINAATDSLNIGNAIGLLGISEHTSNMITGIMMNTENKTFFNALLKNHNKNIILQSPEIQAMLDPIAKEIRVDQMLEEGIGSITEEQLLATYGLINEIQNKGTDNEKSLILRDDNTDKNLSVKYILEVFKMVNQMPEIQKAILEMKNSEKLVGGGKRTSLAAKLQVLTFKTDMLSQLTECAYLGEAIYKQNSIMLEKIKHKPNMLNNKILNIASTLGITEVRTENVIERDLADGILNYLDHINDRNEEGQLQETMFTDDEIAIIAERFGETKTYEKKVHDAIDYRLLLRNNKYLQSKIRMLVESHKAKNEMFVTEKLIDTIINHVSIDNKLMFIDDIKDACIRKEVDNLYVGNLISALPNEHTTVEYITTELGTKTYDMKTAQGRIEFMWNFPRILQQGKQLFDNKNLFLNYIKAVSIHGHTSYGINNLKYISDIDKTNLAKSYNNMYNEARFEIDTEVFQSLDLSEQTRINQIRNLLKSIEFLNLLEQGFQGNAAELSPVIQPFIGKLLLDAEEVVKPKMEQLINDIENDQQNKDYRFFMTRMKMASKALVTDKGSRSLEIKMNDVSKAYTLDTKDGVTNITTILNSDESFYTMPWGNKYNVYGTDGDITPILNDGNKTLRYIRDKELKAAFNNEDIIYTEKDFKKQFIGSQIKLNPQQGEMVRIGNSIYEIEGSTLKYKPTTSKAPQRAVQTLYPMIESIASKSQIEAFMTHVQKVFPNIKIKQVFDNGEIAFVQNGIIYLNMNRISSDIPIHELGHVFTMIVKEARPDLFNQLQNEAQEHINNNTAIVKFINNEYGQLSNEDMIMEIIGNLIQRQEASTMQAFLLQENATIEEKSSIMKLWESVKNFFARAGEILSNMFGGNWSSMETMNIEQMGDILTNAIIEGKALSYMSSDELKGLRYNKLNALSNAVPIKTGQDFVANLSEYTKKYSGMTDAKIGDELYKEAITNGNKLIYQSTVYDFSGRTPEATKQIIRERLVPMFSDNMPSQKDNMIKAIEFSVANNENVVLNMQKQLGTNDAGYPIYSIDSIRKLSNIMQIDKTKKYVNLEDMINNKDGLMDGDLKAFKEVFSKIASITGVNPIVAIEYADGDSMTVSLYDFTNKNLNWVDGQIGTKNIMYKYGMTNNEADLKGITLKNEMFDIRSLMLTIITNVLQKNGVKVRDVSVTKLNYGNNSDAVTSKRVNMEEINHNITKLNEVKSFKDMIENDMMNEVMETKPEMLSTNDINYWELLSSLYQSYYATPDKGFSEDVVYEPMIRSNYENINSGKMTLEQKQNLIQWRLKQLSNIPLDRMTDYQMNESRILLDAYKALDGTSKLMYQFSKPAVMNRLNSYWSTFDIDSEEVQFVRGVVTKNNSRVVNEVRKRKDSAAHIWQHFSDEYGGPVKKRIKNPYYIFEELYATLKTKDQQDAFSGRILWTTDETLDKEFATQAQQKLRNGKLTAKDLTKANEICDRIEEVYVRMLKHQHWMKYGSDEVRIPTGNVDGFGNQIYKIKTLTDAEWISKLYDRGYKRGMIPILQKNYIDTVKSFTKRMGLEFDHSSNEYKEATPDLFDQSNADKTIDDLASIFINQLSPIDVDLEQQNEPNNLKVSVDNRYGYVARNNALGLIREESTGNLVFNQNKGQERNNNINKNLEFVFDFFDLTITRKMIHERETIPIINETVKMLEMGRAFSIDKNTDAVVNIIRNYAEMAVKGSAYKIKNFGFKVGSSSVGEILTTVSKGYVSSQMFLNVNVAINTGIINILKASVEAVAGDKFMGGHLAKSFSYVFANLGKSYEIATDLQVIRHAEMHTYTPGMGGSVSNKSLATSFTSNILNWGTDSYVRVAALISRMKSDGVFDAYTNTKYDMLKDIRYFNADGTQTVNQKTYYQTMLNIHKLDGLTIDVNADGIEVMTTPYTMAEVNAIKEYADKRIIGSYDNLTKSILGNCVIGRMALMYLNWLPAALKGLVGKGMSHETIFKYDIDPETGKVYKDVYFSEGMLVSAWNIGQRAWKAKDLAVWNHVNSDFEKFNMKRLFTTLALGVFMKVLYNFIVRDPDDEDDKYGIVKPYRIIKNIDYAAEGLYMFMYKDGLQRLVKPFVLTDNISHIFDIQNKKVNLSQLVKTLPGGSTFDTVGEVATGTRPTKNLNKALKNK